MPARALRALPFLPFAVIVASLLASVNPAAAASDASAPTTSVYWGAYVAGAPFKTSLLDAFEARTGKKMSIVHWGQPWVMRGANQAFQTAQFEAVRKRGAIPMVSWGSFESDKGPNQTAFRLANIASGKYDAYIKQWAHSAGAWGKPFFLRFDWEMNGWWQFPWAEQANGNQSGDYVRAWRHVHDIFTQQGATNAAWVWCPNVSGSATTPLANLYPGDTYVDWTCMDGYNWGTDSGNHWQAFNEIFFGSAYNGHHNTYAELLALAPSKPMMIGETASSEHGGSKAAWISDMLVQVPTSFPQVRAVVWMDWNTGDASITWPLESSNDAKNAFASGIGASAYTGNQFGSLTSLALAIFPPASPPLVPAPDPSLAPEAAVPAPPPDDLTLAPPPDDLTLLPPPDAAMEAPPEDPSLVPAADDSTLLPSPEPPQAPAPDDLVVVPAPDPDQAAATTD